LLLPRRGCPIAKRECGTVDFGGGRFSDRRLRRPRTEREVRYKGEMWRRTRRRSTLGSVADLRAAYEAHGAELYRFAIRALEDSGLAEEAVQDTFVRAWRAADRHDPGLGSLRTWLFAICRNVIIDLHRARSIRPAVVGREETARDEPADPTSPIEEKLAAWQIEEALRTISEQHRHAIVETYYKGRSYKELARELAVPEATLRSRVFNGMKALRRQLEGMGWIP
jgi:RNA polymerase sigma-70 factor (ECF subfamily)